MFNFFAKNDKQIRDDVVNEIKWDQGMTNDLSVVAHNGIVTLSGSVPHFSEKLSAEQAAQRVGGVRAVADEIQVDLMGSVPCSDAQIAEAAADAIAWTYTVPKQLKVAVSSGWLTLKGEVEWDLDTGIRNLLRH